jgi:ubiquinol-cytochrome c reductase cytochrome b subunit
LILLNNFFNYLITRKNLSYFWNFGSLLGFIFFIQVFRGLILILGYRNNSFNSFNRIQFILYEIYYGWFFRLIHINFVSIFFLIILFHFLKNIFYIRYKLRKVWNIGLFILLFLIIESFLGYVLIWSQISFWACTVITRLLIVIPFFGIKLILWIWRNFFVSFLTLKLFFLIHFILPFILLVLIFFHLFFLHFYTRTSKINSNYFLDKIFFYPYFWIKDMINFIIFLIIFIWILFFPNFFNDIEIFLESNYLLRPIHIVPEWYFLFAYDVLRSIRNKFLGVLILIFRILIFFLLIFKNFRKYNKLNLFINLLFIFNIFFIRWLGGCLVEIPFILLSYLFRFFYFWIFLLNILV